MYFSKDADAVPTFEFPGSTGAGPRQKSYEQLRQHIKKQRHYFADKGPSSQRYGFSSGHIWM